MPLAVPTPSRKVLNDDGKRTVMNAFCSGRSISEIAKHYELTRLTVEVALREALIGLSALVVRQNAPVNTSADSLTITPIEDVPNG